MNRPKTQNEDSLGGSHRLKRNPVDECEEDGMSDYIDENFELDETDELWGV